MSLTMSDSSDDISTLWKAACDDYSKETGITLTNDEFPKIRAPEDLSRHLDEESHHFEDFRMKKRPILHAMQMIAAPFENWGSLIAGTASAAFPPAASIMGAMLLLVRGARRVSESFDLITDLLHKLGHFALRLDSYKGVPLSHGIKTIIVKVLANFLRVCTASQKLLARGSLRARISKWAKNVFVEDGSISSLLDELEDLTNQELKMVSAHGLGLTQQTLKNTTELLERDDRRIDRERLERVKAALNPVSASGQLFSAINESRIPGSGSWVDDRIQSWWQGGKPLLWIHGGPGLGKSYLASKIISDLAVAESAPVVASYFCRNNDVDLRSFNNALRTLAWQVAVQRSIFAAHAEDFCLKEDPADSYVLWRKLLIDYFISYTTSKTTCFIIDGIDEASQEQQEVFFNLLGRTYVAGKQIALRFILLSRDSVRGMLDEHSLGWWIPEIEMTNDLNKDDLYRYVFQKLKKPTLFRSSPELLKEAAVDICNQAEGLWEWANLVIKSVLRCRTKEQIRKVVRAMPRGISAMLSEELQRLARELSAADATDQISEGEIFPQIQQLETIISFVAAAEKPLTVEQLDLILECVFEEEPLNLEHDLRVVFSSLFSLRPTENEEEDGPDAILVTLRHTSFYEYFREAVNAGPIHIDPDQGEAAFLYVLLYALGTSEAPESTKSLLPLRRYANAYLASHFERAHAERAGNLQERISTVITDLFLETSRLEDWHLVKMFVRDFSRYVFYPSSRIMSVACYWWDARKREIANRRAQSVLDWLLPAAMKRFEDFAQSVHGAGSLCSFALLFSSIAASFSRLWLAPDEIGEEDGLPEALSDILSVYTEMVDYPHLVQISDGKSPEVTHSATPSLNGSVAGVSRGLTAPEIMFTAESQRLRKTPIWYARVAQALLLHYNCKEAVKLFQISLDEHSRCPMLSTKSLSVIHRDMARACTEIGMYKTALEHSSISQSLDNEGVIYKKEDYIPYLLSRAQIEHLANLPDKAITTTIEAWKTFTATEEHYRDRDSLILFLKIFLELEEPHHLRSVFDFAFSLYQESFNMVAEGTAMFAGFLTESITNHPRLTYRALHYALTQNDEEYLAVVASIPNRLEHRMWEHADLAEVRYFIASFLFEKGWLSDGLQVWMEVLNLDLSDIPGDSWSIVPSKARTLGHLATVCLSHLDIPFCDGAPLVLNEQAYHGEILLIVSSWLRSNDDNVNARIALRGIVNDSVNLLSDTDPSNDIDAFVMLLKAFLIATDSDEDLSAALYLVKSWNRSNHKQRQEDDDRKAAQESRASDASGIFEALNQVHLPDKEDSDVDDEIPWTRVDPLFECSVCKKEITSIYHWYFCRSCPSTALCKRCYPIFQSNSDAPKRRLGICSPQHRFLYTGAPLQASEYVPNGMLSYIDSAGNRQTRWTEEWKDKLAEKWETADFALEGGLSRWCMRVLPEPQRTRWATFFMA